MNTRCAGAPLNLQAGLEEALRQEVRDFGELQLVYESRRALNIALRPIRAMSRPLKKPSFAPAKRRMVKARLHSEDPLRRAKFGGHAVAVIRPSVAEIIDEHHDKSAKTIRGKSSS